MEWDLTYVVECPKVAMYRRRLWMAHHERAYLVQRPQHRSLGVTIGEGHLGGHSAVHVNVLLNTGMRPLGADGAACAVVEGEEAEFMGIDDRLALARAETVLQDRLRLAAMAAGVTLIEPAAVHFSHDTVLGRDCVIHPHVVFGPGVEIAAGVTINSFSHLEACTVAEGAAIGPHARVRGGAKIGAHVRLGNFVEVKKSRLGEGAKANHLTYVGDAEVGAEANIGAGTITCNYDGFEKHKTIIGDGAFIGSNSALVAPVMIGKSAIVGAGSTIARNVAADALAIERSKQIDLAGRAKAFREDKAAAKAAKKKG